ncbi:MAG: hypothetical protein K2O29_10880 [Ruminococcus sp.]|nr:hypothetical protein [Ruminococcus sp.]
MFTWSLADQIMVDYIEENIETLSEANAVIRQTKKFVREQAKETVTTLSNQQKRSLLDITVRKSQAEKDEKFCIVQPKIIVPVMLNEEPETQKTGGKNKCIQVNSWSFSTRLRL